MAAVRWPRIGGGLKIRASGIGEPPDSGVVQSVDLQAAQFEPLELAPKDA